MLYEEIITVNERFQSSVNLEFDLHKIERLQSYIPTEQSVKILEKFLQAVYYNDQTQRAKVLVGPYGRGKSHLILVLAALLSIDMYHQNDAQAIALQQELIQKITATNSTAGALAQTIIDANIRILPVIINSNTNDITQALIVALRDALDRANLQNLLPTTYFDVAYDVICLWQNEFPPAYKQLAKLLRKQKKTVEDICIGLKQYEQASYQIFCDCYPSITAGASFNPFTNMDVVKLYTSVVDALCEQSPFSGIHIIFDEFSKFLEANLDSSKMLHFKIIQDLAECATRSGAKQIHFTCITHKDILDYGANDSFKTVEGRFQKVRFVASSEQSYELIADAIGKKDTFAQYRQDHAVDFANICNQTATVAVFQALNDRALQEKLVVGCFPLAPLSAFALLRISELVGQNERTLFTFLAQNQAHTLRQFLTIDYPQFTLLGIDTIFDYFAELFEKEVFNPTVHNIWLKTAGALAQIADAVQKSIIKAIAIIQMIADPRWLAIPAHIKAALMLSDAVFMEGCQGLLDAHILAQRPSTELVLLTANGVNIQKTVAQNMRTKISKFALCEVLESAAPLGYIIPRAYNDQFSMLRYFKKVYMSAAQFMKYKTAEKLLSEYPADGLLLYIVQPEDITQEELLRHLRRFARSPQIVLCLSEKPFVQSELVCKLVEARKLLASDVAKADAHYREEVEIYREDVARQIQLEMEQGYAPASPHSIFVNAQGVLEDIYKQVDLNLHISQICTMCYPNTPAINNELVNKHTLTTQVLKGRNKAIDWLLQHADAPIIPCMAGHGPEVSVFKSAYAVTGLSGEHPIVDANMHAVLHIITQFIQDGEGRKQPLQQLCALLLAPPFGLREGVIPLLLAQAVRAYKRQIIWYFEGKEVELSAQLLHNIVQSPAQYALQLEMGSAQREAYLDQLHALFADWAEAESSNRVYSIVKSMQNWMRALPNYTKKCEEYWNGTTWERIPVHILWMRQELLKFETNAQELLFHTFAQTFGQECPIAEIQQAKALLEGQLDGCCAYLQQWLIAQFQPDYTGSLCLAVQQWYRQLPDTTKTHAFANHAAELLQIGQTNQGYSDADLLHAIVLRILCLAIADWSDGSRMQFTNAVTEGLGLIANYKHVAPRDGGCSIRLTLPDGQYQKSFDDSAISPLGKAALRNINEVFAEYNEALPQEEKIMILLDLLKGYFA